jgi:ribonuclease HI
MRLYFDGGCQPNPGVIETAVVIGGVSHVVRNAGHGDNSTAEWLALIAAARIARDLGADDVTFLGDSALVIGQARGLVPCRRAELRTHLETYRGIVAPIGRVHVRHVARGRNLAGIALAGAHPR